MIIFVIFKLVVLKIIKVLMISVSVNYVGDYKGGAPTSNPHGLELGLSTPGTANGPRP